MVTIRQHLKRRTTIAMRFFLVGFPLGFLLIWAAQYARWLEILVPVVFAVAIIGWTVPCTFQRCPQCGRWFDRGEYAGFTWFFVREPKACPRCGLSYDTEWRKYVRGAK